SWLSFVSRTAGRERSRDPGRPDRSNGSQGGQGTGAFSPSLSWCTISRHEDERDAGGPAVYGDRDPQLSPLRLEPGRQPGRGLGSQEEGLEGDGDRQRRLRLPGQGHRRRDEQARPPGGVAGGDRQGVPRAVGVGRPPPEPSPPAPLPAPRTPSLTGRGE